MEPTFSVIKAKFGTSVRAKTPVAQINEALGKVLCHSIVVLIHSIYELGIDPVFNVSETSDTETAPSATGVEG